MVKLSKLAVGVGAALALGYSVNALAGPATFGPIGAIGNGSLTIGNFQILAGNNALGGGSQLAINGVTVLSGGNINLAGNTDFAQVVNTLNGVTVGQSDSTNTPGGNLNVFGSLGAGYVQGVNLVGAPTSSFAGGQSTSVGNALILPGTGDLVKVESQVSLLGGSQSGLSDSKQTLNSQFELILSSNQRFQLNFDATGFLRAALGQNGLAADAGFSWNTKVTDNNGDTILDWSPNGVLGAVGANPDLGVCGNVAGGAGTVGGCTEFADSFKLNQSINALSAQDNKQTFAKSPFEVELFLAPGTYNFSIAHTTTADAKTPAAIPEPTTLALLGLGLVGLGAQRRRSKTA